MRASKRCASAATQRLCAGLGTCFFGARAPDGGAEAGVVEAGAGAGSGAAEELAGGSSAASSACRSRRNAPTSCQSFTCHLTSGAKPSHKQSHKNKQSSDTSGAEEIRKRKEQLIRYRVINKVKPTLLAPKRSEAERTVD